MYAYMKPGIVHFKAYPAVAFGEGPIVETLRKICEDDFWMAVEVGWMKDVYVQTHSYSPECIFCRAGYNGQQKVKECRARETLSYPERLLP